MTLEELKDKIISHKAIDLPICFINKDSSFLIKTYIEAIAKNENREIKEVFSLNEIDDIENSMFKENDYLYTFYLTKDQSVTLEQVKNYPLILISEKDIKFENSVTFEKPLEWQVEEYFKKLVPGLDEREAKWICSNAKYDIDRIKNEADKLNIFDKKDQSRIFQEINNDNGYCDLNELTIFNLSSAIMKKDVLSVKKVIQDIDNIDVEGTGLVTILIKNFYNIIQIQTNKNATPDLLGISPKQFNYLKYNQTNIYSNDELVKNFDFLTSIDYKLKSGLLEMSNQQLVIYVISHVLN